LLIYCQLSKRDVVAHSYFSSGSWCDWLKFLKAKLTLVPAVKGAFFKKFSSLTNSSAHGHAIDRQF